MENKVLVELLVPELEETYDVYLPIAKRIGNIVGLLVKAINEMGITYNLVPSIALYNRNTFQKYNPNAMVYETDIRNGSVLVLL